MVCDCAGTDRVVKRWWDPTMHAIYTENGALMNQKQIADDVTEQVPTAHPTFLIDAVSINWQLHHLPGH